MRKKYLVFILTIIFLITLAQWVIAGGHESCFGWDGDKDAAIAYRDGSFRIRDGKNVKVGFGIYNDPASMKWYNHSGYLPCLVTEFERDGCTVKIMNFGDKVTVSGNDYVAAYSRVSVYNHSEEEVFLDPQPSKELIALNIPENLISPGDTKNYDFVIAIDRLGNSYVWPSDDNLACAGTWEQHFDYMKTYWDNKLSKIVNVVSLPDPALINAYKAGYIYTHIVKDMHDLHVGENGYDGVWDHDSIGIIITLFTLGDFSNSRTLLDHIAAVTQYDDAKYKYSWPYAFYLLKTDDVDFIASRFDSLKKYAHTIANDRTGPGGIIKMTNDIDSNGYWTVDNWSAMMGLLAYKYVCQRLGEKEELSWAENEYNDLLRCVDAKLTETITTNNLNYIPVSMVQSNNQNRCSAPNDANWAAQFLFGRWAWDGYLFNGDQYGVNLTMIDDTYDYGFGRLEGLLPPHDFGGYPHGFYSSCYNAGYGSAALRGERYRSEGIYAYKMMIESAMTGPFSWWEGILNPKNTSWEGTHPKYGNGASPHMWGQSVCTKVLIDSLIAEKIDGKIIIGRGIPEEWIGNSQVIELNNYPISGNRRMGVRIQSYSDRVLITFTGDSPVNEILIDLPVFLTRIKGATAGNVNFQNGRVTVSPDTKSVTVYLSSK